MSSTSVYNKGTKVWIPHPAEVWEEATVVEDYDADRKELVVQTSDSVKMLSFDEKADNLPLSYPQDSFLDKITNLSSLTVLHEATVNNIIKQRFKERCLYNYCGTSLLFLNPYKKSTNYDTILKDREQMIRQFEPQIFGVAEKVYRKLQRENCDQAIIFTGESGAGKTENAKQAILHLTTVSAKDAQIKEKILASSKVLESLGNAESMKNENSSRFVQFMELQYDKNYHIIGASLKAHLVDRSRIGSQVQHEEYYRILHQLYLGKDNPTAFRTIENSSHPMYQSKDKDIEKEEDKNGLSETFEALKILGFSEKQRDEILKILVATIHLGNINFRKFEGIDVHNRTESCTISDSNHLLTVSKALSLDEKAMTSIRKWMCHRKVCSQKDEILQPMTVEQAMRARDSLVKFIYTKLFNWIVIRINASFRSPCNVQSFIGILDTCGFESISEHSFEQFCINYLDEKVQQHFIQSTFKLKQEQYIRDEIGWNFVRFQDNRNCIELIEGKSGIIDIIDDVSKVHRDDNLVVDIQWIDNLRSKCEKTNSEKLDYDRSDFIIQHFFSSVPYNAHDIVEKNRDIIAREQLEVLKNTKNELLGKIVLDEYYKLFYPKGKRYTIARRPSLPMKQMKKSVINEFRSYVGSLSSILNKTKPYHVRCINTNEDRKAYEFNATCVVRQLRIFDIVNTINLSSLGFSDQITYANFLQRYFCLLDSEISHQSDLQEICKRIVNLHTSDGRHIKYGKSKIFMQEDTVEFLEKLRAEKQYHASIVIQKRIRGYLQEKRYGELRRSICGLQRYIRGFLARKRVAAILESRAAIKIQALVRGWLTRRWYFYMRRSSFTPQSSVQLDIELNNLKSIQNRLLSSAATKIQSQIRGFLARRQVARELKDIIIVQSCIRRFIAKIALKKLKEEQQDERLRLFNKGLEKQTDLLQEKINYLMEMHLSSGDLEQMHSIIDDQICIKAKNRILNQLLFSKIEILKELREKPKTQEIPKIEYAERNHNRNSLRFLSLSKPLGTIDDYNKNYHKFFQSFYKFDQRANRLKVLLGIRETEFMNLKTLSPNTGDQKDEKTSTNEERNDHNYFNGMLQFNLDKAETLVRRIIELDPTKLVTDLQLSPELPALIILMCIRYSDSMNNNASATTLISNYIKRVKILAISEKQFDLTVFWLLNSHRLLNYLKQYSKVDQSIKYDTHHYHGANLTRMNEQRLRNLDLSNEWKTLEETCQWLAKRALIQMKARTLPLTVAALLDNEEIKKLDEANSQDSADRTPVQKVDRLVKELSEFHKTFKAYQIDRKVIVQMFKQLFDHMSSIALSNVLSRKELCTSLKGLLIRCNLRNIERWSINHRMSPAIEALLPINQAARFLQSQPIQEDDLDYICCHYTKLNLIQITKIVELYNLNFSPNEQSDSCNMQISLDVLGNLQSELRNRQDLEDTILTDDTNYPIIFPFHHSSVQLEEVDIPSVLNLTMLRQI